jgi:hypothetical protein
MKLILFLLISFYQVLAHDLDSINIISLQNQLDKLRLHSFQLLESALPKEIKRGIFHRYLSSSNFIGFQRYMSRVSFFKDNTECNTITLTVPFTIDNQTYKVTIDAINPKQVDTVSSSVGKRFPAVEGLKEQLYQGIVTLLREKAFHCADDSQMIDYDTKYCQCMYTKHTSYRNHLYQPNIIGLCPELAINEDFIVIEEIVSQHEASLIINWAKQQKNQQKKIIMDSVDNQPSCSFDLDLNKTRPPFHSLSEILNIDQSQLKERMKKNVMPYLASLPIAFKDSRFLKNSFDEWFDYIFNSKNTSDIYIFVREFSSDSRSSLPWHRDSASYSINLSLNNRDEYGGGDLQLYLGGEKKVLIPSARKHVGTGVGFGPNIAHSIEKVTKGTRWSLVMFFSKRLDYEFPQHCFANFTLKSSYPIVRQ